MLKVCNKSNRSEHLMLTALVRQRQNPKGATWILNGFTPRQLQLVACFITSFGNSNFHMADNTLDQVEALLSSDKE